MDRVALRIGVAESPWAAVVALRESGLPSQIGAVDWIVELLPASGERQHTWRAAEAVFAAALSGGCRVFLEPLIDFDRTMDVGHGLLDRRWNPRPAFYAARMSEGTPVQSRNGGAVPRGRVLAFRRGEVGFALRASDHEAETILLSVEAADGAARRWSL